MKTTAKNLRELNAKNRRNGDKNRIFYAGYYILTMDGSRRAYYAENADGIRVGQDFTIKFNEYEENIIE